MERRMKPFYPLLLACAAVLTLCSCRYVEGPRASRVITQEVVQPDGTTDRTITREDVSAGRSRGGDVSSVGGSVTLPEPGKPGGATGSKITPLTTSEVAPLYVIGGILIVGAVAAYLLIGLTPALVMAGAGVLLLALTRVLEAYPWAALLGVVALLGIGGYVLYGMWWSKRLATALDVIVPAIDGLPTVQAVPVTQAIKAKAKAASDKTLAVVKKTVTGIKLKQGL